MSRVYARQLPPSRSSHTRKYSLGLPRDRPLQNPLPEPFQPSVPRVTFDSEATSYEAISESCFIPYVFAFASVS